ncbi:kelch-like protein 40 [Drosophila bipectinata]|uniref:kelch-like protein 40 n=1 Tax=Drosophila bipectinata TaxID=42026 RepID=UPI001C89ABF7|nr:kelch-like protein 40 [Drosophila bipectinata]
MNNCLQKLYALLENKQFSDCRIMVDGQGFDCHKVVLASASEFFERMFLSDFKESNSGEYILGDVNPETFAVFLEQVYTHDTNKLKKLTIRSLMELRECATRLLVPSVATNATSELLSRADSVGFEDLIVLFENLHNSNEDLKKIVYALARCFKDSLDSSAVMSPTRNAFHKYITELLSKILFIRG